MWNSRQHFIGSGGFVSKRPAKRRLLYLEKCLARKKPTFLTWKQETGMLMKLAGCIFPSSTKEPKMVGNRLFPFLNDIFMDRIENDLPLKGLVSKILTMYLMTFSPHKEKMEEMLEVLSKAYRNGDRRRWRSHTSRFQNY